MNKFVIKYCARNFYAISLYFTFPNIGYNKTARDKLKVVKDIPIKIGINFVFNRGIHFILLWNQNKILYVVQSVTYKRYILKYIKCTNNEEFIDYFSFSTLFLSYS